MPPMATDNETDESTVLGFWLRHKSPQVVKQVSSSNTNNGLGMSKRGHDTTPRSQNAEQLQEHVWLRCSRKPQSFKTYDSSEFGVWSSYKGSVQTADE